MSYAYSRRAHTLSRHGIAVAIVAAVALPTHVASAQLGGLVKKARDKVVENQVDKQVEKRTGSTSGREAPPKFDDVTLELTSERVGQIIRGLSAGRAVLEGSNGSPSRATLVARRDEAANKSAAISSANNKLISAHYQERSDNQRCRNDAIHASYKKRKASDDVRQKEFQAKAMSDPAFREKTMAIAQKMGEAQARNDTVALKKLAAELGVDMNAGAADSIAADKACGREPARPAVLVQVDQLDEQAKALSEQIRQLEEKSAATEVKESGLNERQFHMARERIEAYLSAVKYKAQPGGFSGAELESLGARRADLEKVM